MPGSVCARACASVSHAVWMEREEEREGRARNAQNVRRRQRQKNLGRFCKMNVIIVAVRRAEA